MSSSLNPLGRSQPLGPSFRPPETLAKEESPTSSSREAIKSLLKSPSNIHWKGGDLEVMINQTPETKEIYKAAVELMRQNSDKMAMMKSRGWESIKNDPTISPSELGKFQTLRKDMEFLVGQISVELLKLHGTERVAFGTESPFSDRDPILTGPHLTHTEETLDWTVFNMTWHAIFLGLPEFMADITPLTTHTAESLKSEQNLSLKENKGAFLGLELQCTSLQNYRALAKDPKKFDAYCAETLGTYQRLGFQSLGRNAVRRLKEAQALELSTKRGILQKFIDSTPTGERKIGLSLKNLSAAEIHGLYEECLETQPVRLKEAEFLYKAPLLLEIAEKMDTLSHEIEGLLKSLQQSGDQKGTKLKKIEALELEKAGYGALRKILEPEGYLAQGTYNDVCAREGGQIHLQKLGKSAQPLIDLQYAARAYTVAPPSLNFGPEGEVKSTPQELLISGQENLGMFQSHFQHDLGKSKDSGTVQKAFIARSKYLLRVTEAHTALLGQVQKKGKLPAAKEKALMARLTSSQVKLEAFEKIKRQKVLPFDFAIDQLANIFGKEHRGEIETLLSNLKDPMALYKEGLITPEELFTQALSKVAETFFKDISEKDFINEMGKKKEVLIILRSLAGISIDKPLMIGVTPLPMKPEEKEEMQKIHQTLFKEAEEWAIDFYKIRTEKDVETLVNQITEDSRILETACRGQGIIPMDSIENEPSLLKLWQSLPGAA